MRPGIGASMPHTDGSAVACASLSAFCKTRNVERGSPRRLQLETACELRPVIRATAAFPPSNSITSSAVSSRRMSRIVISTIRDGQPPVLHLGRLMPNIHTMLNLAVSEPPGCSLRWSGMDISGESAEAVARRLKLTREALGLGPVEMARRIGISYQAYAHYEAGGRIISLPSALKLCSVAGIHLDWIYRGIRAGLPGDLNARLTELLRPPKRRA
jgi:DNA-binding XRE family transcriptional regulator